tara:strand:- start:831 stop:1169 length:339 start_codon:yes stop_codon:yes gene_type:complete
MIDKTININRKNILNILKKESKEQGKGDIEQVYNIENVYFYSWKNGKNINKHRLPNTNMILYGDIFIINISNKIKNYTVSEYGELYYFINNKDENKKYFDILLDEDTTEYIL